MYLDPGFGGMFVQIVVTIVAAGGAIAFALRRKIKALFTKNKNNSIPENQAKPRGEAPENDAIDMLSDDK